MTKKEEVVLKATKEILVKFIETGRVYPSSFEENFKLVNQVISDSLSGSEESEGEPEG